ncbi:hypothetical protein ABT391_26355 [Streptomyces jumonjinensis]
MRGVFHSTRSDERSAAVEDGGGAFASAAQDSTPVMTGYQQRKGD